MAEQLPMEGSVVSLAQFWSACDRKMEETLNKICQWTTSLESPIEPLWDSMRESQIFDILRTQGANYEWSKTERY